jgi:hypothetical protein
MDIVPVGCLNTFLEGWVGWLKNSDNQKTALFFEPHKYKNTVCNKSNKRVWVPAKQLAKKKNKAVDASSWYFCSVKWWRTCSAHCRGGVGDGLTSLARADPPVVTPTLLAPTSSPAQPEALHLAFWHLRTNQHCTSKHLQHSPYNTVWRKWLYWPK